jgi:hypothetical protein
VLEEIAAMVRNGPIFTSEGDLVHLTTGWVGAPIGWDFSYDGWILFPPAPDRFLCREDFGVDSKEKEKTFCPKEKGGNRDSFSQVNKQQRDSLATKAPTLGQSKGKVVGLTLLSLSPKLGLALMAPMMGPTVSVAT